MSSVASSNATGDSEAPATASLWPRSPWLFNPALDLMIGCGAWSGPLLLLAVVLTRIDSSFWTLAFYFLALLFNYPHFMATVYRAYHTRTEFARYRLFTVHATLLLIVAGLLTHLWYALLPWVFTLYISWSPWHYTGQNFGLLMMFTRRSEVRLTESERRAFHLAFLASFVMLILSFNTGNSGDALILSLGLPGKFTIPLRAALATFFVVSTGWALARMALRSSLRTIIAPATLAFTQFLWFLLPVVIEIFSHREVPQTRYSSGLLAVLHSTQYLWITSYYQAREARAAGDSRWKFWRYVITLLTGGIALFIPGPWIVSRVFHADFAASFLTFTALVNIHHFLLDGAIWKLRDSRVASLLLNPSQAPGSSSSSIWWFARNSMPARALRIALVLSLFLWAAVDQARFYLSNRAADLVSLRRAATWNPNDSAVQLHLASAEQTMGEIDGALRSLERATRINPQNTVLHETYARALLQAGRNGEAYEQFAQIAALEPRNADAWVNIGLLAQGAGRPGEARDAWNRAIAIDPHQAHAQLYLAQSLEAAGEFQAATRHYQLFLDAVSTEATERAEDRDAVLGARIKIADANFAANRIGEARNEYEEVSRLAKIEGNKSLEALAAARLADAQEKLGDNAAAARSYQRTIVADAALSDAQSSAADWFNYAQFLLRRGQPERLAYACLLEAEAVSPDPSSDSHAQIVGARLRLEKSLGKTTAAAVRRDLAAVAREALSLSSPSSSSAN